jgi:antitoxin component YwqK of YwqJK toxin-antitoxin module
MSGNYADDSCHVSQGEFVWFDEKGIVSHRCNYLQGKLDGTDTFYYPDGHKKMTGRNREGDKQGEWLGFYPNGKISGKAKYEKGKQVSATFFHEDGSPDKSITAFMKNSEYPGGVPQFLRFLNKTLRYPDTAVNHEIQGTVIVSFKVSKEGKASEFRVIQSVDQSLDAEALGC